MRRMTAHWSTSAPGRRRVLAAGLATLATGAVSSLSPRGSAATTVALRKLAADKGLLYGTTIAAAQITDDRPFVDLVRQEAGLVVAENEMKWQVINRGAPGDDDYAPADIAHCLGCRDSVVALDDVARCRATLQAV